jgi:nucleoside-diphosphate-sugar epimerase
MEIEKNDTPIKYISGKPSMIPIRKISSNKMKEKYSWERKHSLEQGLKKTIDWYREYYIGE